MKFFLTLMLSCLALTGYSQNYSRVKVYADAHGLAYLSSLGVTVDHGTYKQNTFFISDFSTDEIAVMASNGFEYEILIPDVQQYYIDQTSDEVPLKNATCTGTGGTSEFSPETPTNFNLGTMGGYLKYNEMLAELDAMVAQYPNLITAKAPISTYLTHENRPIYYVRLSDNPNTDEAPEPKVLYTAIHHAREPMSLMETIFYMWYLLENYGSNDEVTYLVNNLQLYFVPCINPDGYVYNQTTNPNGGGMWRKNRRNNGGGVYGVDLNRNYSYGWGTTGTSTNTSNDTYCGPSAFSEPETQAMRWLVQNNNFVTAFNAHTYAEEILFPIGTTTAEFAMHHNYFQAETNHMVQYNGYLARKSSALYPASGDSDDYMYKVDIGVNQKDTIFAHTPEVGTAFWQPSSQIDATCKEMVFPNLVLAHIARKYVLASDEDPSSIATLTGNFNHSAYRLGREDGPVTVSIQPLLNIVSVGSPVIHNLAVMQTAPGAISYSLNPAIQFGDEIRYVLLTDNGMWIKRDTIIKTYGALTLQVLEDATTNGNWVASQTWNTTTSTFVSPSKSFTDSPTGNYTNNANKTYTYVPTIDLTNATSAAISYYAKWNIETDYDCVQFQVSTNGGTTWTAQCTNYTVPGTSANGSAQPNNQPVYEGVQSAWVLDEVNLSDYLGQVIKVRFQLRTDGGQAADGFYFDDFKIFFNEQGPAVAPTANFTVSSATICEGESVGFTDFSTDVPTTWSWNFGDNTTSSAQNPTHVFNTPGVYSVSLVVSNAAGNDTYTMTNAVTVVANPIVSLSTSVVNNTLCINDGPTQLTATPSGSTITGNGMSGNAFDPAVAGIGNHQLIASYTNGSGCIGYDTLNIIVEACANIDNLFYNGVSIQPNPNNGVFEVTGLELGQAMHIYDMHGKLIHQSEIVTIDQSVKLKGLDSGIYYLRTTKNGRLGQMKFAVY